MGCVINGPFQPFVYVSGFKEWNGKGRAKTLRCFLHYNCPWYIHDIIECMCFTDWVCKGMIFIWKVIHDKTSEWLSFRQDFGILTHEQHLIPINSFEETWRCVSKMALSFVLFCFVFSGLKIVEFKYEYTLGAQISRKPNKKKCCSAPVSSKPHSVFGCLHSFHLKFSWRMSNPLEITWPVSSCVSIKLLRKCEANFQKLKKKSGSFPWRYSNKGCVVSSVSSINATMSLLLMWV